jgi:HAD superfamily hydrolase (TIGR01490 family)
VAILGTATDARASALTDPTDAPQPAEPPLADPADEQRLDELARAASGASPEHTETELRYARPDADRLGEAFLAELGAGRTGAIEAAFFDLDKTIIARSSTLAMSRTFLRDGLIGPTTVLRSLYAQLVYNLVGADHERMEQARHALLDLTKGWEAERIRRLVRETMEHVIAPLVYREALELFSEHRQHGRDVWIVSSSGEEIVVPFAEHLGIGNVIATRSGLDDHGCYDGTLEFYAYAGNKATAIRQVAEARGYDLARSYVYSDSITDLPFLNAVGNPVAVNPDRELRAAAHAMGWPTRDFVSPVSLRSRLPDVGKPSNEVLAGAAGVMALALLVWRVVLRGDD